MCDDSWDNTDAGVACRQLGFSRYSVLHNYHISIAHNIHKQYCIADAVARANAFYGQGSGPINIDDPGCTGSEQRLIDCLFSPVHDCVHSEDAGVDCTPDCK